MKRLRQDIGLMVLLGAFIFGGLLGGGPLDLCEAQGLSANITGLLHLQVREKIRKVQEAKLPLMATELETARIVSISIEDVHSQKVFIYFDEEPTNSEIQALENLGVTVHQDSWIPPVGNHSTGFLVADMPIDKLDELANKSYVVRLDTAEQMHEPLNDLAAIRTNVDDVWDLGHDGTGITIAVLDSGLDTNHPDIPAPVASWDYAENDATIGNTVTGHGTHVTGIALGRGTQSAGEASEYTGVAPGANLVFFKVGTDATGGAPTHATVQAMQDAVDNHNVDIINYSYGGWSEYHDGSSATNQAVDYAVSQGAAVFCAAGNEGNDDQHFSGMVPAGTTTGDIQVNVTGAGLNNTRLLFNTVWFDGLGTNNDLELTFFDSNHNQLPDVTALGQTQSPRGTEAQYFYYDFFVPIGNSTYFLRVTNNSTNDQFFHIYYSTAFNQAGAGDVTFQNPDPSFTLSTPATADNAIAVASYTTRANWTDFLGGGWTYGEAVNTISTFSSRGPRVDGELKPSIAAPGSAIISARDQDVYPWNWPNNNPPNYYRGIIDNDGLNLDGSGPADYFVMQGTSMASPHAAGVAALLLEAQPALVGNPDSLRCVLEIVAGNMGAHNDASGYGVVDAQASVKSTALGLCWLLNHQNANGSWSNSVGLSSLATLAFLNSGHDETDPAVKNAIDYITSNVKGDGSIWSLGYKTYETSLAVLALVATYNGAYTDTVENAADWLRKSQWDESCLWETVNRDNWYYGGFGYGSHIRPDLSNTQFALMALDSVISVPKDDELWDKAQIFLARTQMRQQDVYIPDLDYTVEWNLSYNKYDDGGFVYYPGVSLSSTGTSYGSMTAAGIWNLRLCDVPPDNPRVQTALNWLLDNYTWDSNPGMTPDGRRFQYYYYLALSKALTMALESDEFNGHDWYGDMSTKLIDLQHSDGHWVNSYAGHGGEGDPTLCTSYSILSLQVREIPTNIQRLSWMTFILRSNADLHVYDPLGRHVGMNYETGQIEIEIPDATFVMNNTQEITVPRLEEGKYIIKLVGTGTGEYELTVTGGVGDTVVADETIAGFITEGEVHEAIATVAMIVGLTIDIMVVDNTPPEIEIEVPQPNQALQDGVTFTASASDQSGVASLAFYVREPNDGNGIPIGYECLAATLNGATGKWEHAFDTTQLPDGNYVILAEAVDNKDNEGWSEIVPFSIRNWAVIELLPNTANNKAGRTMPVKFALRIAAAVDPLQPFVYNEELEIRIYDASEPDTILQTSLYGDTSKDYRIDTAGELYITNFKTSKKPAEYVVEIWRMSKNFLVGSFTFETVK
jgi:squalene-hopene/tetraprenyl-beta-curcumene cyclase